MVYMGLSRIYSFVILAMCIKGYTLLSLFFQSADVILFYKSLSSTLYKRYSISAAVQPQVICWFRLSGGGELCHFQSSLLYDTIRAFVIWLRVTAWCQSEAYAAVVRICGHLCCSCSTSWMYSFLYRAQSHAWCFRASEVGAL